MLITSLQGGWLAFDQVRLDGPSGVVLAPQRDALVKTVAAAEYETEQAGKRAQPLLVDLIRLNGKPLVNVRVDGKTILTQRLEQGEYILQAPMAAVKQRNHPAIRYTSIVSWFGKDR